MPGRVCKHTRTPCLLVSFGVSLLEKLRHMYVPIIPTRTILTNKIQVFQKYTSVRGVNQPLWGIGDHTLTRRPIRPRELIGGWAEVRVTWQEWTIKALTSGRPRHSELVSALEASCCDRSFRTSRLLKAVATDMEAAALRWEDGPQLNDAPTFGSAWPGAGDAAGLGARRAPPAVGAGLRNLGNTCYANAALQCLTYTAPLTRRLLSRRHAEACPRPASCVLCAMRAHVARARWRHGEVIQPATGLIAGFHAHKQEDAHEFLMFTVDAMHQACLREPARRGGRGGGDSTPIRRTFGGYWRSQVKCLRCHGVSDTLDPYLDITLDIQAVQSVTQALELLVKPEKLDGDNSYHCSVCLEKVPASKTLTLHTPSEVLILVLKRFSDFTGSKLAKEVQYPEHLDMRQYLSQQDAGPLEYELYAVLVHAGWTCHSGHYFCYIKAGNGQWFKMDDARVTACDVSSALSQDAYVLFYTQKRELQRDSGSVSAGEGQRCHGAERAGTREPETRSEVRRPEAEEPERGPSGAQVTWEQWRLLQEQSRPAPQFNLRRVERALPADAVVIHASKFSGGVTRNHPERETQLLGDAAGDMAPPGARHTVPCLGGRAKAAKRKKKGWRPLDVLG